MRERFFLRKMLCGMVLLCGVALITGVATSYESMRQYQAVVGTLYREDPAAAEQLLNAAFRSERTEESLLAGQEAAEQFGYTDHAYRLLRKRFFPNRSQMAGLTVLCLLGGVFFVMIRRYCVESSKRMGDIVKRMEEAEETDAVFAFDETAEGSLRRLEHKIFQWFCRGQEQRASVARQQEQTKCFTENLAHQIKAPLTTILLNLEMMQERLEGEETIPVDREKRKALQHFVQESLGAGDKIRGLLLQLLNLARMEAGRIRFRRDKIWLEEIAEEIRGEYPEGKVFVVSREEETGQAAEQEKMIYGDYAWIHEALFNLIDNSVKYGKEDCPVWIEMLWMHETVKISIRNEGASLSETEREQIFTRYYVGDSQDSVRTGIGLHLAKQVIQGHHGSIQAVGGQTAELMIEIRLPRIVWKEKVVV